MTYYPRFQVGENKLRAELLNRVMTMLQWYEGQYRKLEIKKPDRYEPRRAPGFWAQILNSDPLGNNQWRYDWFAADKIDTGYAGWAIDPDGKNSTDDGKAYNLRERINNGVGVEGNGINVDDAPGTFAIKPVPPGTIVRMWTVSVLDQDTQQRVTEYWFAFENAFDGVC